MLTVEGELWSTITRRRLMANGFFSLLRVLFGLVNLACLLLDWLWPVAVAYAMFVYGGEGEGGAVEQ